jgi:hypothetical protein
VYTVAVHGGAVDVVGVELLVDVVELELELVVEVIDKLSLELVVEVLDELSVELVVELVVDMLNELLEHVVDVVDDVVDVSVVMEDADKGIMSI